MLDALAGGIPASWTVRVLADRALYARGLFQRIGGHPWPPFLRIQRQGYVRRAGQVHWHELRNLLPTAGPAWTGAVTCFKPPEGPLACPLLVRWDAEYSDPWLRVTDRPVAV